MEAAIDLGYRAVMPAGLGAVIASRSERENQKDVDTSDEEDDEEYADIRKIDGVQVQRSKRSSKMMRWASVIQVTPAQLLGMKRVRAAYAEQIGVWRELEEVLQRKENIWRSKSQIHKMKDKEKSQEVRQRCAQLGQAETESSGTL